MLQCVVVGLRSGELVVVQYGGTFPRLLRRVACAGELTSLRVSQAAGRMVATSADATLYTLDLTRATTL